MKIIIHLIISTMIFTLGGIVMASSPNTGRPNLVKETRGYFFRFRGNLFFTEHLNTTYPQFRVKWKNKKDEGRVCISDISGRCPNYSVRFIERVSSTGEPILTDMELVSPFNDPLAKLRFYESNPQIIRFLKKKKSK